jgi:hypothetical protein
VSAIHTFLLPIRSEKTQEVRPVRAAEPKIEAQEEGQEVLRQAGEGRREEEEPGESEKKLGEPR